MIVHYAEGDEDLEPEVVVTRWRSDAFERSMFIESTTALSLGLASAWQKKEPRQSSTKSLSLVLAGLSFHAIVNGDASNWPRKFQG